MRGLAILLGATLLLVMVAHVHAQGPKYNLGVTYDEVFPSVERGGVGESTLYFFSAYGTVTCYVTVSADEYPPGWRVEFDPEMVVVEPKWFSPEPFDVPRGETCLLLQYKDENGNPAQGWVHAYPIKVSVRVPSDAELGTYKVKLSYVGDFRMQGMSVVKRAGSVEWNVEVVEPTAKPPEPFKFSPLHLLILAGIGAVPLLVFTRSRWAPPLAGFLSRVRRMNIPRPRLESPLMAQLKLRQPRPLPAEEPRTPPEGALPTKPKHFGLDAYDIAMVILVTAALLSLLSMLGLL
jgi:hypothetical protein